MTDTGDNRLPVLAAEIRKAHADAKAAQRKTLAHAIEAGQHLIEAKALVGYGGWLPWLETTGVPERMAQRYMRLARNRDALKSDTMSDLTITAAMEALAGEVTPTEDDAERDYLTVFEAQTYALRGEAETLLGELKRLDRISKESSDPEELRWCAQRAAMIGYRAKCINGRAVRMLGPLYREIDTEFGPGTALSMVAHPDEWQRAFTERIAELETT